MRGPWQSIVRRASGSQRAVVNAAFTQMVREG
jgi:hypothetical protein